MNIIENNICGSFDEQVTLTREIVNQICLEVIETMKNGLPDKAHSIEVFNYILKESKDMLQKMPVKL